MSKTILLVDDEEVVREAISTVLIDEGYRVVVAKDGEEALELAQSENPDFVIIDADIPKKNGFEVCMELKGSRLRKLNHVPVMMITGVYQRPENKARALLRCKADDYILKPFKREEFLHRIKVLMHKESL
jgi:two-component system response regulator VicR